MILNCMEGKLLSPQTNKQYEEYLWNMIGQPLPKDGLKSKGGKPRDLKAYIIESDDAFPQEFKCGDVYIDIRSTGLDDIKILSALYNNEKFEFFLDISNKRFCTLHTNENSNVVKKIMEALTSDHNHMFDHTWFYSSLLKKFSNSEGNKFNGLKVSYNDEFLFNQDNDDEDDGDSYMSAGGHANAVRLQQLIKDNPELSRKSAYRRVRISRGSSQKSIQDDVYSNGYFAVKYGKSISDHLDLINSCKKDYSKLINNIEDNSIGTKNVDGKILLDGDSFDFEFKHEIEDLELFISKMFNSTNPFKLWGLKSKIANDYYNVAAVDLHMGSPMNFNISKNNINVSLYKGYCGNTILRLFANLQIRFDSNLKCEQFGGDYYE